MKDKPTKAQIAEARKKAIANAMSVNNCLTETYLKSKSDYELLCFVHPFEREVLALQMGVEMKKPLTP